MAMLNNQRVILKPMLNICRPFPRVETGVADRQQVATGRRKFGMPSRHPFQGAIFAATDPSWVERRRYVCSVLYYLPMHFFFSTSLTILNRMRYC